MTERYTIFQNLYNEDYPPITLDCVNLCALPQTVVDDFLATVAKDSIGIAAGYDNVDKTLVAFALSSESHILLITFEEGWESDTDGKRILQESILCKTSYKKYAWNANRLATALHVKSELRIAMAFDIQYKSKTPARGSMAAVYAILDREEVTLDKANVAEVFRNEEFDPSTKEILGLRAWACCRVGMLPGSKSTIKHGKDIDTTSLSGEHIEFLEKQFRDEERLQSLQPGASKKDVNKEVCMVDGLLQLTSSRYSNRIRDNQTYHITTVDGTIITGRAVIVSGKTAKLELSEDVEDDTIVSVLSTGRDNLTSTQIQQRRILEEALRNPKSFTGLPFVQMIFAPPDDVEQLTWPESNRKPSDEPLELDFDIKDLNDSQTEAVDHALSPERITMILGPPGTGKTTVIAAIVISIINGTGDKTVWIVAHSNVAVRNIAEKLVDCEFTSFKLLVSQEFSYEWHDHLYTGMAERVIQSGNFSGSKKDTERDLDGVRVILCTLSMITSKAMIRSGFVQLVPIRTLIVDEASQIEVGEYLPLLSQSASTLEKLVFIGDDKQLAPHGQDDIEDLQSIFEIPHLRQDAILLDTQYRLPHFIGEIISEHVYDGQLKTVHKIASTMSCRLVDVQYGREVKPVDGTSWINQDEIKAVVYVARKYKDEYRKYKVITPYDAQRDSIEKALKHEGLQWQDTVFNLDSFQGNEEDHIIISLVRSGGLGFLKNQRRMNVMLTRCKLAMIICSSKRFLQRRDVAETLVGKLVEECMHKNQERAWISWDSLCKGDW